MSAVDHENATIAVVDDDRAARDSICAVIQSAGHSTVAFESGEALLSLDSTLLETELQKALAVRRKRLGNQHPL